MQLELKLGTALDLLLLQLASNLAHSEDVFQLHHFRVCNQRSLHRCSNIWGLRTCQMWRSG